MANAIVDRTKGAKAVMGEGPNWTGIKGITITSLITVSIRIFAVTNLIISYRKDVEKRAREGGGVKEPLDKGRKTCGTPTSDSPPAAGSSCARCAKEDEVVNIIIAVPLITIITPRNINTALGIYNVINMIVEMETTAANTTKGQYNGPKGTTSAHLA